MNALMTVVAKELTDLFRPVGVELRTLADFPGDFQVSEDGDTFAANARLKAVIGLAYCNDTTAQPPNCNGGVTGIG